MRKSVQLPVGVVHAHDEDAQLTLRVFEALAVLDVEGALGADGMLAQIPCRILVPRRHESDVRKGSVSTQDTAPPGTAATIISWASDTPTPLL